VDALASRSEDEAVALALTVAPSSRAASLAFYRDYYLILSPPDIAWTGNRATCDPGTTAADFRDKVLQRINYFRGMAGVPEVTFDPTYSAPAQAAALMMSVNHQLNHFPPSDWLCYSVGGAQAAQSSNLAYGAMGWDAISLYMDDPGLSSVGHRRWLLYPQTQTMGTGDQPSGVATNVLWVFGQLWGARPPTREPYVAWPPPGYVPYNVAFSLWSFSYPNADFSSATVTMSKAGFPVPVVLEVPVYGYGEATLVWTPGGGALGAPPTQGTTYDVAVNNVRIGSAVVNFNYQVTLFSPAPTFVDVPFDNMFFSSVELIHGRGITAGCDATHYCPDLPVTRAQMAVFLEKGMRNAAFSPHPAVGLFADVAASHWAAAWIEQLYADGITAGCGSNTYCPDSPVTRAQMAVFLLKSKHGSAYSPPGASGLFADVPPNHWAASWIEQLAAEDITAGCGGGDYCPDSPVTRGQMAAFLSKTFGY